MVHLQSSVEGTQRLLEAERMQTLGVLCSRPFSLPLFHRCKMHPPRPLPHCCLSPLLLNSVSVRSMCPHRVHRNFALRLLSCNTRVWTALSEKNHHPWSIAHSVLRFLLFFILFLLRVFFIFFVKFLNKLKNFFKKKKKKERETFRIRVTRGGEGRY